MKKIIHVNRQKIDSNKKHQKCEPPITIKTYKNNTYAQSVEILGPCKIVHNPKKPLSCGAKVWIETNANVLADGIKIP